MKNNALQKPVVLACILSIYLTANYVMALGNSHETNENYITVRESLIPMFARRLSSSTYNDEQFPFSRINPKAKEYIRFYLEKDKSNPAYISQAIWLLGFIGDVDDISFIEQYIDKILESSTNPDNRINISTDLAGNVGCFAGMMMKRDIKGTKLFLKKYAKVSSWMVHSEDETLANFYAARKFYSIYIMCAYQYSKSPYIATLLQEKSSDSRPYIHESFVDSYLAKKEDRYNELIK